MNEGVLEHGKTLSFTCFGSGDMVSGRVVFCVIGGLRALSQFSFMLSWTPVCPCNQTRYLLSIKAGESFFKKESNIR